MTLSNYPHERVAELRREIAANKGKKKRAEQTISRLYGKISTCDLNIRLAEAELRRLGAKVR